MIRKILSAFGMIVWTALQCCLAEPDSSLNKEYQVLEVLWQKELKDGIPEGYEEGGKFDSVTSVKDKEAYVNGWIHTKKREVIRVELVEMTGGRFKGRQFYSVTWIYNRRAGEEDGKELKAAGARLLIMDDIGPYKNFHRPLGGRPAERGGGGYMYQDQISNMFNTSTKFKHEDASPHVDHLLISVWVTEALDAVIPEHEFLRAPIQFGPELASLDGLSIIKAQEGNFEILTWKSGDHHCVRVAGGGIDGSKAVSRAYLQKYPSTLTKDFKIDKEKWGREDVETWLGRMKRTLDAWDTIKDKIIREDQVVKDKMMYYSINTCIYYLAPYAELPLGDGYDVMKNLSFEESQYVYNYLSAWWQKGREKAYWDEKQRRIRIPEPGKEKSWWPFKK